MSNKAKAYLDIVTQDWQRVHPNGTVCKAQSEESCPYNRKATEADAQVTKKPGGGGGGGNNVSSWNDDELEDFVLEAFSRSRYSKEFAKTSFDENHFDEIANRVEKYAEGSSSREDMLDKAERDVDALWENSEEGRERELTDAEREDDYRESQYKADKEGCAG